MEKAQDPKRKMQSAKRYDPKAIENKWQVQWQKKGLYRFTKAEGKQKYYNLVEFPYPSGDLHLGHWFAFVPPDVHARYQKMSGRNVFFTNGFDAFGLPAENAAIKRNIHPRDWTMSNIETMTKQFATMGTMIDWSHKVITCETEYFKWNQWIFLKMYEKGLAYRGKTLSNWCPVDQTVLANEHVENGKCWRCGSVVEQKEIEQWFLKITEYAEELLWPESANADASFGSRPLQNAPASSDERIQVDWPQSVRVGQNEWIGKSEGAEIEFGIENSELKINVFTTRADTIFGATFLVLAPEHSLLASLENSKLEEVRSYIERTKKKTELERKENKEKTGVFTGLYAINPLTKEKIPVWIADYVLPGYGTGAIMAVPAHDQRDYEFAKKHSLPIRTVITAQSNTNTPSEIMPQPQDETYRPYEGEGVLTNSGDFNGQTTQNARKNISDYIQTHAFGEKKINYHIHDWSISRQRYWGTPVPIIHCDNCGIVPVPYEQLPVEIPYEVDYTPKGKPPLATAEDWLNTTCPKCKGKAKREAETLDTFFDSSWYFYRFINPEYEDGPFDEEQVKELMPVDVYFGGAEHTLGHTLYARFFTKFFHDLGMVPFDEFAKKRIQHGVILGPDGNRMSKSKGNVVNPDDVVREYGSDTVRLYLCFMMPYEAVAPWSPTAISGIYRFLKRIWDLQEKVGKVELSKTDLHWMHKTIKAVGDDIREFKFNTGVSSLMEWLNHLSRRETIDQQEYKTLLLLLAPFAPHISEEIWSVIGEQFSVHQQSWPVFDSKYLQQEEVTIVVQINGKLRATLTVSSESVDNKEEVVKLAQEQENIQKYLAESKIKDTIYVKGKILNFVV